MRTPNSPTPLGAVLAVTFINSVGTGVANNGIFFLTKSAYGFGELENYALALLLGVTYIGGALRIGPAITGLAARSDRVSTRAVLAGVLVMMGAACLLPSLARALAGPGGGSGAWGVWAMIAVYSPVSGALWPITEAYISGGRSGAALRGAIGRFNITWAGALVVCYWAMAPLVEEYPLGVVASLGALHVGSLLFLPRFGREPGRHLAEHHEPHPPVYARLLAVQRVLLPASYVVLAALTPYLPTLMGERLGIAVSWQTPAASLWLGARLVTFAIFDRWHGWHGRWWAPIFGSVMLLGGFAAAVVSPGLFEGSARVIASLAGLGAFGVGMSVIYSASLYYAMEVGRAEVDAGGIHEALIGVGYTLGPLCGLATGGLVARGVIAEGWYGEGVLAMVGVVACAGAAFAARMALRADREEPERTPRS